MTGPGQLTLDELGERWPEAVVLWDRDVASQGWTPVLSGNPILRLPHLKALAFDAACPHAAGTQEWEGIDWSACQCMTWTGRAWITLHAARYEAVRSALRGERFPCDALGAHILWIMLGGCAAEITPSSLIVIRHERPVQLRPGPQEWGVTYIMSGRPDRYELSLAPSIISFLLGGIALPETGHAIRRIHRTAAPFDGSCRPFRAWDEPMLGARYLRIDDVAGRTVFRIRDSEAALAELGPEVPVMDPPRFLVIDRACPHCGRIPERYRLLSDGSFVCTACGRSTSP